MSSSTERVLVVGSGGREHAIVDGLIRTHPTLEVFVYPGNPGMWQLAQRIRPEDNSIGALVRASVEKGIGLVVVGPEAYLDQGIVDAFTAAGIPCFGPTKAAARLETSKSWAKQVMRLAGVPTAEYREFSDPWEIRSYISSLGRRVAVKADGLAAGKGVLVTDNPVEAAEFAELYLSSPGSKVIVEEALSGKELSLFALVNGDMVVPFSHAQDYKPAYDGDKGPNTGGMGAICPADSPSALTEELTEEIITPVARQMKTMGVPFCGVIFAGLMLTEDGPYVLEFNARFGDPEAQVMIPRLDADLYELIQCIVSGQELSTPLAFKRLFACGVTIASEGYPVSRAEPEPITIGNLPEGTYLYHAGTSIDNNGKLIATGGRVFTAVGLGHNLDDARDKAYSLASRVSFKGAWYRRDIGSNWIDLAWRRRAESNR